MSMMSLIVAMDDAGLIGRDNDLPWRLPSDLAFFKRTTMGKPIIMGRKTYESIGKPLPGRENVVITRQAGYSVTGCTVVESLEAACAHCESVPECVIIGGAQIYAQALNLVQRMYITRVHAHLQGDAWFPEVDWTKWKRIASEPVTADERNIYHHTFECWEKQA